MAGATLEVEFENQARDALDELERRLADLSTPLGNISEYLHRVHEQRFEDQVGPDGEKWKALSPRYQQIKKKNKNRILDLEGNLKGFFRHQINDNELSFGTNVPYASYHQFGTKPYTIKPKTKKALAFGGTVVKSVNHPGLKARPFFGLNDENNEEILRLLRKHLLE